MTQQARSGFTLIEILIAVAIMVILTTIGLVSYRQVGANARDGKRQADLQSIRQALVIYRTDNGSYPNYTASEISGNCSGSSDRRASYVSMLNDLESQGYLAGDSNSVVDPRDGVNCYGYRYAAANSGRTFELCAKLESDATPTVHTDDYCLTNP